MGVSNAGRFKLLSDSVVRCVPRLRAALISGEQGAANGFRHLACACPDWDRTQPFDHIDRNFVHC
jgi:hypothetical protein